MKFQVDLLGDQTGQNLGHSCWSLIKISNSVGIWLKFGLGSVDADWNFKTHRFKYDWIRDKLAEIWLKFKIKSFKPEFTIETELMNFLSPLQCRMTEIFPFQFREISLFTHAGVHWKTKKFDKKNRLSFTLPKKRISHQWFMWYYFQFSR